ncbi:MAG TPA: hypothetical protein PLC75_04735, partial [Bacillota bacterium]|nr:hypothetical protein [Bacillota bacterium]
MGRTNNVKYVIILSNISVFNSKKRQVSNFYLGNGHPSVGWWNIMLVEQRARGGNNILSLIREKKGGL